MSVNRHTTIFDANTAGLKNGINQAKASLGSLKTTASGIGAAIGGAISFAAVARGAQVVIEKFDRIGDLAKRFGVSAETMQRLGFAAEQSGADVEGLAAAMQKAIIAGGKAGDGNLAMAKAFETLGISVEKFNSASPEEKMVMLADSMKGASSQGQAFAAATAIMGRGVGDLIPMLQEGGDAMREMLKDAPVATNEAVAAAQELDDAWKKIKASIFVATQELIRFVKEGAPVLSEKMGVKRLNEIADSSEDLGPIQKIIRGHQNMWAKALAVITSPFAELGESAVMRNYNEPDLGDVARKQSLLDYMHSGGLAGQRAREEAARLAAIEIGGEEGPASAEGIAEYQRLAEARRLEGMAYARKKTQEGIDFLTEQMSGMSATGGVVASSLAQIGGGGGVFEGFENKQLTLMREQKNNLVKALVELEKITTNTGKSSNLRP